MLGPMDMLLFGGAIVLLFGPKKLPELMKGLGSGLKEFKKAQAEIEEEIAKPVVKYSEPDKSESKA
jgi:sec-independent protein translocase protein TatA